MAIGVCKWGRLTFYHHIVYRKIKFGMGIISFILTRFPSGYVGAEVETSSEYIPCPQACHMSILLSASPLKASYASESLIHHNPKDVHW